MRQLALIRAFEPRKRVLKALPTQTSFDAFRSVPAVKERARILSLIARFGQYGLTADEAEATGSVPRGHQRFAELRRLGFIKKNGQKRPTRSGRMAEVYVVVG